MTKSIIDTIREAVPDLASQYPSQFRAVVRAVEGRESAVGQKIVAAAQAQGYGREAAAILADAVRPEPTVLQQATAARTATADVEAAVASIKSTLDSLVTALRRA